MVEAKIDNVEIYRKLNYKCCNKAEIEIKLKLVEKEKYLSLDIIYFPINNIDSNLILHWGIVLDDKFKWIQPPSCLFSSNGSNPKNCDDGISCDSQILPSNDGSYHSCQILFNIQHLKSSHEYVKINENEAQKGIENCENIIDWLNDGNKDWGISFVLYSIPNVNDISKVPALEVTWIKNTEKYNSDFFIPLGQELFLLRWMEYIFINDKKSRKCIEYVFQKQKQTSLSTMHYGVLRIASNKYFEYNMFQRFFNTNCIINENKSIIWVIANNNLEMTKNKKLLKITFYTNIAVDYYKDEKTESEIFKKDYDIILHFGLTKSTQNINWVSPYKCLKIDSELFSLENIDDKSSEIQFKKTDKYSSCILEFLEEKLILFKALVFVIKLKYKTNHSNSVEWIKSENNQDFIFEIPPINSFCHEKNFVTDSKLEDRNITLIELQKQDKKNKDWKSNIQRFLSESDEIKNEIMKKYLIKSDSIMTNRILYLSEGIGLLRAISFIYKTDCIVLLQTISERILKLHWGLLESSIKGRKKGWKSPPENCRPCNTTEISDKASETELSLKNKIDDFIFEQELEITIDKDTIKNYNRLACVFKTIDEYGNIFWHKEGNRDIEIITSITDADLNRDWKGAWSEFVREIITAEVDWGSITLMHRYNLMDDIIQRWSSDFKKSDSYNIISTSSEIIWCDPNILKDIPDSSDSKLRIVNNKYIQQSILTGKEFWIWLMIWMRFNALGILDWQRNYNTAPRLLAHSAENVSLSVISKWFELPNYRSQIRFIIQTIIRGGSRGQEVRDRILHIMHKNHIPELHGTFYEQWHQKLHNNTTPDDVAICRSVIGYLRSNGNEEVFSRILTENGLSSERIASYDRPITAKPFLPSGVDINSLAHDFEQYLEILIDVHEALNLQRSLHYSRPYMNIELQNICASIVFGDNKRFDDTKDLNILHERLMLINQAREKILNLIYYSCGGNSTSSNGHNRNAIKEIMFLDLGLENLQSMFIQTMCTLNNKDVNPKHLINEMSSFLWILFGHDPTNKELGAICYDWKVLEKNGEFSKNYLLLLKCILERVHIFVGNLMDETYKSWDSKVVFFGVNVGLTCDDIRIKNFMDEILRSTLLSTISLQIKRINNYLLSSTPECEFQNWQFISYNPSWRTDQKFVGVAKKLSRVTDFEDKDEHPKIIICSYISGEEDIPMNVIAIILTNPEYSPDILSHLSIRARNMNVLVVVCQNTQILSEYIDIIKSEDIIEIKIINNARIDIRKLEKITNKEELFKKKSDFQLKVKQKSRLFEFRNKIRESINTWVLYPNEMDNNKVGQKALNLVKLHKLLSNKDRKLPFFVPTCVSLPFGTLIKLLNNSTKEKITRKLNSLEENDLNYEQISNILNDICFILQNEIEISNPFFEELYKAFRSLDYSDTHHLGAKPMEVEINKEDHLFVKDSKYKKLICEKIKQVWCSVYQPLAYINMKKIGQSLSNVFMSVIIQRLISAKYAFVLHSKNPIQKLDEKTGDYDEMYGEIVIGIGETLVSNMCGKSMGFTAKRIRNKRNYQDNQFIQDINIVSLPSKSIAMFDSYVFEKNNQNFSYNKFSSNYIFRSDSNAEDIEGFAGAGVFQSVPLFEHSQKYITYLNQPLIIDQQYRAQIIKLLATIAFYIQDEFNNIPQDIEGCIVEYNDEYSNQISFNVAIVQSRPQI